MLKIGEFSALARVSVKTLRYYDELGLLRPARIDRESGYRYYSASQLPRLHRILTLKDIGFPLDRIAKVLDGGVTADVLRGMLLLREAEQQERLQEESERLVRVRALLRLIEQEGARPAEVILKQAAPQQIASIRDVIPSFEHIGELFERLFRVFAPPPPQCVPVAIWHDSEFKEGNLDLEVGVCLNQTIEPPAPITIRDLPAATVASIVHHGAFDRMGEAYLAILHWIEANRYRQAGPAREYFLHVSLPASRDDESNVTEIQLPVEKASV